MSRTSSDLMKTPMNPTYKYRPLRQDEIRVLHLEPGSFGTPLVAKLQHGQLEDLEMDYEAISYASGEPVFTHTIYIPGEGALKLTESLHSALQHLRYQDEARVLWANAVCIDQSNIEERSAQVTSMHQIYQKGLNVNVGVGPSRLHDALAFGTIIAGGSIFKNTPPSAAADTGWLESTLKCMQYTLTLEQRCLCCSVSYEASTDLARDGLTSILEMLLERARFSRMWVVQEV